MAEKGSAPGGTAREKLAARAAARDSAGLPESNLGHRLLVAHGWAPGEGLGKEGEGRVAPVEAFLKRDRRGVGGETVASLTLVGASGDGAEAAALAASAALVQRSTQAKSDAKAYAEVQAVAERKRRRDAAIATSLYRAFSEPERPRDEGEERPATRTSKSNPLRRTW